MSKERLERIKERVNYHGHLDDDVEWLIEQAERVEELEEEKDEWKDTAQSYYMTNQELREQNKRYREVISQIKNNIPLKFNHSPEYEAKKNVIRLINIDNLINDL